jgi:hypothetical protein
VYINAKQMALGLTDILSCSETEVNVSTGPLLGKRRGVVPHIWHLPGQGRPVPHPTSSCTSRAAQRHPVNALLTARETLNAKMGLKPAGLLLPPKC